MKRWERLYIVYLKQIFHNLKPEVIVQFPLEFYRIDKQELSTE